MRRPPVSLPLAANGVKLRAPPAPDGVVARPRLTRQLQGSARVALIVAPAGFGKTTVAEQFVAESAAPTAWLSRDAADGDPADFWHWVRGAIRGVLPDLDDRTDGEVVGAGGDDLRVLLERVRRSRCDGVLVLDGVVDRLDRPTLDDLASFVERAGDHVRCVITARADPRLPLAAWRANGWVTELDEADLRFTAAEAELLAGRFEVLALSARTIVALNWQVDGWPMALHLALVTAADAREPESRAHALLAADELVHDYFVTEVLGAMSARSRSGALALSVLDGLDAELCHAIVGQRTSSLVAELGARHLIRTSIADEPGTARLHPMFRRLLAMDLRWRDPHRHAELHRRAALVCLQRDDHNAAYRHLVRAGDAAADELVMSPALAFAVKDDRRGLSALVDSRPRADDVEHPGLACDLAVAALFAGRTTDATRFCERAEVLSVGFGDDVALRVLATQALLALRRGDFAAATAHVGAFERMEPRVHTKGPVERHFALAGARAALARRDLDEARRWLDKAHGIDDPAVVAKITVPALDARFDLLCGRLQAAAERIDLVCERAHTMGVRPHAASVEAEITAALVRLAVGEVERAASHAQTAIVQSERLGYDRDRVRAGLVAAHVRMLTDGPAATLAALRDLVLGIDHAEAEHLHARVDLAMARAHLRANRPESARVLLGRAGDRPSACLARAEVSLATRRHAEVAPLLDGSSDWLPAERLEAELLLAAAERSTTRNARLAATLEEAAASSWVSPFLGHIALVEDIMRRQPLERLHPRLAAVLRRASELVAPPSARAAPRTNAAGLTARELSILQLLPSHRSYAQIGAELYLSHNTVKSNLKSIYRKLGASTRSDAVDAARDAGIIWY